MRVAKGFDGLCKKVIMVTTEFMLDKKRRAGRRKRFSGFSFVVVVYLSLLFGQDFVATKVVPIHSLF